MKGFYAFAAAVALGSLITASAYTFKDVKSAEIKVSDLHQETVVKTPVAKSNKLKKAAASRAEEAVWDQTKFTQFLYFSYFDWYVSGEGFANDMVRSSCEVNFTEENGHLYMNNLFGYEEYGFAPIEYTLSEHGIEVELGQVVYSSRGNNWILAAIGDDLMTEGSIEILGYSNALAFDEDDDYWIGYLCVNSAGVDQGWEVIGVAPIWFEPNATITFTNTRHSQSDGDIVTEVSNRVYVEFVAEGYESETAEGTIVADVIYISNVTQWNEGYMVSFLVSEGYALSNDYYVYPSQRLSNGSESGIYMLAADGIDDNGSPVIYVGCEGAMSPDYLTFQFPFDWDAYDEENGDELENSYEGFWFAITENNYYLGDNTPATITFDYPINEDKPQEGIESIAVDNNSNAPVEFYTLQGVKVSTPAAGQIIIVKQGSKATKAIIR